MANSGNRVATYPDEGIYSNKDGANGHKTKESTGATLKTVSLFDGDMALIQEGFYNVVKSSSANATGSQMRSSVTTISGKTSTAETYTQNAHATAVTNLNLNAVAYDESKTIAVVVKYPQAASTRTYSHQQIARDILNQYGSSSSRTN
ncbi:penicillin-binding transpeptidase domain-containing protein [Streptococcus hyointestinalis]|uniref:penicillin-binding transpeptidase domain-containing protein n=1 Tax=Streptococcus hyointestinalis TaxID=1337 RepID=UPI0013DFB4C2|nr:penicillin-binding transpeptidase domain-containing protein [Streptococcus hyointestinalis]